MEENNIEKPEEVSVKKDTKKSNSGLIIVLVLIIAALAGYICYDKVLKKNDSNKSKDSNSNVEEKKEESNIQSNEQSNTQSNEQKAEQSKELTTAEKNDIIGDIETITYSEGSYAKGKNMDLTYLDLDLFKGELADEGARNAIIVYREDVKKSKVNSKDFAALKKEFKMDGWEVKSIEKIDADYFAKTYKDLFGGTPKYKSGGSDPAGCTSIRYSKTYKNYYLEEHTNCGIGGFDVKELVYIDSFNKNTDQSVDVTMYGGTILSASDFYNNEDYKKYDKAIQKEMDNSTPVYINDLFGVKEFDYRNYKRVSKFDKIDSSNKNQFTKYIVKFEKDSDGNYYYKSTKRV